MNLATLFPSPLRAFAVLPLALLIPGWALAKTLKVRSPELQGAILASLCVTLSFSFYIFIMLLLDVLRVRYSTGAVVLATDVLVAIILITTGRSDASNDTFASAPIRLTPAVRGAIWFVSVVVLCASALLITNQLVPDDPPSQFAELYFGTQFSGITAAPAGRPLVLPIAVANNSNDGGDYVVNASVDGKPAGRSQRVSVARGTTWSGDVTVATPIDGCIHHVVVSLERPRASTNSNIGLWVQPTTPRKPCP
jgi:hypothetical protein